MRVLYRAELCPTTRGNGPAARVARPPVPDLPIGAYPRLLDELDREFTYTFGGCTIIRGLDGSYLSRLGVKIRDRINLLYSNTPFAFEENFVQISRHVDELRAAAHEALDDGLMLDASRFISPTAPSSPSRCVTVALPRP